MGNIAIQNQQQGTLVNRFKSRQKYETLGVWLRLAEFNASLEIPEETKESPMDEEEEKAPQQPFQQQFYENFGQEMTAIAADDAGHALSPQQLKNMMDAIHQNTFDWNALPH